MNTYNYFAYILVFLSLVACIQTKDPAASQSNPEILGIIPDPSDTITMDYFIGANGFIDDPIDKLSAVQLIREYHNWNWDEGDGAPDYPGFPNNQIRFAPSYPGWSFDDYYTALKKQNIIIIPCIQGSVNWLHTQHEAKPIDQLGLNTADPYSYHAKAHFMYQLAARYGSKKCPDSTLSLAPDQNRVSGLGLIKYIEDWNEQDKNWEGPNAEFSPEEYAAMASANYDGHVNTMNRFNKNYGIKNADPSIKHVMGGLASLNLNYIKRMKKWFEQHRSDKIFATDVLNFHIYAFKDGKSWQGGGPAISPEDAKFKEKLIPIVKYRNEQLPKKEIWVSEFGWDTNPASPLSPPSIGTMDIEEVQGIWLVRAFLAFASAGVDRAQMYMMRDVDPNSETWFASSGLIKQKGDFTPKKSWFYIAALKNILAHTRYIGEQKSSHPHILIYKFKNIHSTKGVYVVWAKTSQDYKISDFPLKISKNASHATQTVLSTTSVTGITQSLEINNQEVRVNVSEKPIFISVNDITDN